MSNAEKINCLEHGEAVTTYVCDHLIKGQNHEWHCREPDAETPWPDSWCGICHQHFEDEGEWNEFSEVAADLPHHIKLLCNQCYENLRAKCNVHFI